MSCSHSSSCELYPLMAMEPALKLWKQHFCEGQYEKCARYALSKEGKPVPLTLLPNGKQLAPRSKDEINAAALFNAIQKHRLPLIRSMFKTGVANTEASLSDGCTPLMAAATLGHADIVEFLLAQNANPYRKNKDGQTALQLATAAGHAECAALIEQAMQAHSPDEYASPAAGKDGAESDDEAGEKETSSIVGFLRRLNPFKTATS
ncbi:MAG TPA: ankyrin repeat domain-containing protein [Gammaproteobacteria bacterium]|nr:ankyrin repeat domain-containing protein [Gammaproteobacteria bacterium]